MTKFKRENRYVVLKIKDIEKYLSSEDMSQLAHISNKILIHRCADNGQI